MKKQLIFVVLAFGFLFSCKDKNRYFQGEKDNNIVISFQRFEPELNAIKESNIEEKKALLAKKYGEFYQIYNKGILRIGEAQDSDYNAQLLHFLNDSIYKMVYDTVEQHFPNMDVEEKKLTAAFKKYNRIFPDRQIPQCYTHISGFNTPIVVGDSILSISLENYLGNKHNFYKRLGCYNYLLENKNPQNIASDAIRGWLISEFPRNVETNDLLNNMIQEGKIIFLQHIIMPKEPLSRIIGLSERQYTWCEKNELSVWQFTIEKQYLFSKQQRIIAKYLQNAPFFNFYGIGSSPMIGKYIGWQIVNSYMNKNKDVTIDDLIRNISGQKILEASGYKP